MGAREHERAASFRCRKAKLDLPSWQTWLLTTAAVVSILAALVAVVSVLTGNLAQVVWLLPLLAVVLVGRFVQRRANLGSGSVSVRDDALFVAGQSRPGRINLAEVRSGARVGCAVSLELGRNRRAELELESETDAQALLQLTGAGVAHRTQTFALRTTIGPFVAGLLFYLALIGPVSALLTWVVRALAGESRPLMVLAMLIGPLLTLPLSWWFAKTRVPTVTIGQDGIVLHRWFADRFIPHSAITSFQEVSAEPGRDSPMGITLELEEETLFLSTVGWSERDIELALARLRDARGAFEHAREAAPRADTAFVRRGRSVGEWRQRLIDSGFRQRVVTAPDAEAVLSDPTQPLEHRAGAAIALRVLDPERGVERIRVAADVAADPRARELLLATLDDDAEVEAALDRLER